MKQGNVDTGSLGLPMSPVPDPYQCANRSLLKALQMRWHQQECKRQILRSQVGFALAGRQRPDPCQGCRYYHGKAYGLAPHQRTKLVCGIYPYGWQADSPCPDWQSIEPTASYDSTP